MASGAARDSAATRSLTAASDEPMKATLSVKSKESLVKLEMKY